MYPFTENCPCSSPGPMLMTATASRLASATYSVLLSGENANAHGCVPGATGLVGFSSVSLRPTCPLLRSSSAISDAFHSATNARPPHCGTASAMGKVAGTVLLDALPISLLDPARFRVQQ